jgi:hypothetical protein
LLGPENRDESLSRQTALLSRVKLTVSAHQRQENGAWTVQNAGID